MSEIKDYKMGEYENLYHYTSVDGLKGIIENRTIRFSDYRFLNDIDEIQFGKNLFREVLEDLKVELPQCTDFIISWEKELENINVGKIHYLKPINALEDGSINCQFCESNNFHYYLLSLTTLADNKDMWHMYSDLNSGYRLKLNANKMMKYFYDIRDFFIGTAIFSEEHRSQIFYGAKAKDYIKQFLKVSFENDNLELKQYGSIFKCLAFVKDEAFRSEQEYRLGFCFIDELEKQLDKSGKGKKVFTTKKGVLYPSMEFQDFPIEDIIEEIMISPYNKSELAEIGLKEFLEKNRMYNTKVIHSCIKIR